MTADLLSASWDAGKASVWTPAGFELTYTAPDGKEIRTRLDGVRGADLDGCLPVRSFPSYKGQRNYPGLYWSATMGRHVGFESWVERNHLISLDFAPEVTAIASQPFWLHWRTPAGRVLRHAPDFLARLGGGRALVIDSRPRELAKDADRKAFAATRLACEERGWGYAVCGAMDPVVAANHRWIAGYRHPRYEDAAVEARLLEIFDPCLGLLEGAEDAGDPLATLPVLYHLLWRQDLLIDLTLVLSHRTVVHRRHRD